MGYGDQTMVLSPDDLLKSYSFSSLPGLGENTWSSYEQFAFIGHFAWFVLCIALINWLIKKWRPNKWQPSVRSNAYTFMPYFWLAGIVLLVISFGDYVSVFQGKLKFDNWLSPFYYLEHPWPEIKHFRYLSRFHWPFFFVLNLWAFMKYDQWIHFSKKHEIVYAGIATILLAINIWDMTKPLRIDQYPNVFARHHTDQFPELDDTLYQAILPIPYYNIGNNKPDWTINADKNWQRLTFQLSLYTGLPLMSMAMSRTPLQHSLHQYSIFQDEPPNFELVQRLTNQPILVVHWPKAEPLAFGEITRSIAKRGHHIIEKYNMICIAEKNGISYYQWDVDPL